MKTARLTLLAALVTLAACAKEEPAPAATAEPEGRAETRSIRNTQAIGYDGKAIADKVDATLQANDQRVEDVQREADADAPPPD